VLVLGAVRAVLLLEEDFEVLLLLDDLLLSSAYSEVPITSVPTVTIVPIVLVFHFIHFPFHSLWLYLLSVGAARCALHLGTRFFGRNQVTQN